MYDLLTKAITSAREDGHYIIEGGDFNKAHKPQQPDAEPTYTMSSVMTQLSLELASAILGKYITLTYNQFKTTLDHVWMSIDLYITGYGYRAFKSDHCGVFIHLKLHHCSNTPIQAGDKIKLSSKNPASVLKYLDDLKPKVNNHPLLKKVESLITKDQLEGTDAETLQSGDKFLTDMQLATEAALYSNKTIHCFLDKLHHMKFI